MSITLSDTEIVALRGRAGGQEVQVYRNNRRRCWSIRGSDRRVIGHVNSLTLGPLYTWDELKFYVSRKGRMTALRNGRKSTHAWISGRLQSVEENDAFCDRKQMMRRIGYDPFRPLENKHFVYMDDQTPVPGQATRARASYGINYNSTTPGSPIKEVYFGPSGIWVPDNRPNDE